MEVLIKEGLRRRVRSNRFDDAALDSSDFSTKLDREVKWYTGQSSGTTVSSAVTGLPPLFTDWDTITAGAPVATTHMILVAPGVGFNQRLGDAIDLDSIEMSVTFQAGSTNFDAKIWLVWQEENASAVPVSSSVFMNSGTGFNLNSVMALESPMIEANGLQILHEHHLNGCTEGFYSSSGGQLQHSFRLDLTGLRSRFNRTNNFPVSGTLRFYLASRSFGAGNPTFAAVYQLLYRDAEQ